MTRAPAVVKAALMVLLALGAVALAQETPEGQGAAPPPSTGTTAAEAAQNAEQMLQQIQQDNEAVLAGKHFTYDPAGRRDPFEPLVKPEPNKPDGKRPKGVAGMMVAEIDLRGVATDVFGNAVALFRGSDNRSYSLRVGDVVYDGRVLAIDPRRGAVVFRQQVDDPRRIKPYRDVIKRLQVIGGEEGEAPAEEEGA